MKSNVFRTLKTIAAIACGVLLAATGIAGETAGAEKLGWRLGVQAYTFRALSFFETVDKAHELGIKYIEMYPGQKFKPDSATKTGVNLTEAEIAEMQAKLKAADVKLVSFGVAEIPADEAAARQRFEWAKKLGIEVLVTETTPNAIHDKLAKEFGIKVAIHNHPTTWAPEKVLAATEGLSAMVGSCSDVGHWKRAKLDTVASLKLLGSRVIHSHFKDLGLTANGKGLKDVPWGTGLSDASGMMAQLKSQGFKGYLMVEYENGTVPELMQNIPLCIQFFNATSAKLAN